MSYRGLNSRWRNRVCDGDSYYHHPNEKLTQLHYQGQVDLFAVFCRQTQGV